MQIPNYRNYGMCDYNNTFSNAVKFQLGHVVINESKEIGVIIQIHSDDEFRTDMFGNCCAEEIRLATDDEILELRPTVESDGQFVHE